LYASLEAKLFQKIWQRKKRQQRRQKSDLENNLGKDEKEILKRRTGVSSISFSFLKFLLQIK